MTKEQETIEYIEKRIKICNENADICDDNNFDEQATCLREESYMLETVLNILKDLQRKNKRLTQTNKSYKGIINKQNRQMDLMADNLIGMTFSDKENIEIIFDNKEDVKRYFERKATNNG